MSPRVSVVLPVYNGERFVEAAIRSVLAQTMEDLELVVVDDGSTDATSTLVKSVEERRIRYIHQASQGPAAARNRGLAECRSDLVAFIDADDEWLPCKVSKQLALISPGRVVYSDVLFWDESTSTSIGGYELFDRFPAEHEKFSGNILRGLLSQNIVHPSTVMAWRDDLLGQGGFDRRLRVAEDWDLWLRLSEEYDFLRSDSPLALVRRRDDSHGSDRRAIVRDSVSVLLAARDRLSARGELDDSGRFAVALGYFGVRAHARAWAALGVALLRRPWSLARWRWMLASLVRPLLRGWRS